MHPMKYVHWFFSIQLILLFGSAVMFSSYSFATEHSLRVVINAPGTSPFIYFDTTQNRYQGVVVDFFESFDELDAFDVEYIDSSRARNEQLVITEKADLFLGSSVWMKEAERFMYSDSLMPHYSFMYATQNFENEFLPEEHYRALICTRYGFSYPELEPYFAVRRLIRVDSSSQTTMTLMLAKGRSDYAIMSEENAQAIMSSPEFCEYEFFKSPSPIDNVNIGFIMGWHLTKAKAKINQQLSVFINSGERDKSIRKHVGPSKFPKRVCVN